VMGVIKKNFGELITSRKDGAQIGPWNAWLHFPQFGKPAWALNNAFEASVPGREEQLD
jgi:4-carboxymuconolactone decarboxylase